MTKNIKKKKKKKKIVIFLSCITILLLVLGLGGSYVYYNLSKFKKVDISDTNEDLGIEDSSLEIINSKETNNSVTNIALFGLDQRDPNEPCRSDAMMVLSVDQAHKKIKMISIMRDSYVNIDGHGEDKLNHAYAFGGPQLAIKTLNKNFKLNIKDFISINFFEMEKLIDDLGGVEIDVKPQEMTLINEYMQEVASITNTAPTPLEQSGHQLLNGRQALSYSRIRHYGDGDYERTERQRKVLEQLMNKIISANVSQYPSLINKLSTHVETSLSNTEMLSLGTSAVTSGTTTIEKVRFPYDGYFYDSGKMINGVWYLPYDLDLTSKQIHDYIYDDVLPKKKDYSPNK